MPKILIADTYYPDFLKSWQFNESADYETELNRLLDFEFGTGRAYSRNLRLLGWEVEDIIANADVLQSLWAREHMCYTDILKSQICDFNPDVLFFQDLSLLTADELRELGNFYLLAGQCSCPMPAYEKVQQFDVLFTSFPHYIRRFEEAGVKAVYNPLGFEPSVLDRLGQFRAIGDGVIDDTNAIQAAFDNPRRLLDRIHDCVFIGGVGNPSHWKRGMETLHAVAEAIPTFKWWGYGVATLPEGPLKQKWQGSAFGLDMYRILLQSKIALCRHGEVSEGYANAMRIFEATGCGALLLTEEAPNIAEFFNIDEIATYGSPETVADIIGFYLYHPDKTRQLAANGQRKTLGQHTYQSRMRTVSDTLKGML